MIFKTPNTREERQKILQILIPDMANKSRYLDSQGEFMSLFDSTWDRFYTHSVGRTLGQFANAYNSPTATPAQKQVAMDDLRRVATSQDIRNREKLLKRLDEAGLLNEEEASKFNSVVTMLKQYVPDVVKDVRGVGNVQAGLGESDFVGQVTGEKQAFPDRMQAASQQAADQSQGTEFDEGVNNLVDKVLREDKTTNLEQYPWWNSSPYKKEAYEKLRNITSTPESLAEYVKSKGLTDLQNYSWWRSNPNKQDAWNLIQQAQPTEQGQTGVAQGATQGASQPATSTTGTPSSGNAPNSQGVALNSNQQALDIINNSDLPEDIKAIYRDVVNDWNPEEEINADKIIQKFQEIKNKSLDPYYRSLIDFTTKDFQDQVLAMNAENERELEAERAASGQNIRQAREGISQRGLTFSGESVAALGAESAYAQPQAGQQSAIPTQTPFGGMFYEGTVNQANRLMASSNLARRQEAMKNLGKSIEAELGSGAVSGFGVNYVPSGGITGNIQTRQKQEEADTLTSLINQQRQNQSYQPVQYNF